MKHFLLLVRTLLYTACFLLFVNANCTRTEFKPFDVVSNPALNNAVDDNGYLINPLWGQQRLSGASSLPDVSLCGPSGSAQDDVKNWLPCTDNAIETERGKGCGPHVNFLPVHYESQIFWADKTDAGQDDDYNVTLVDAGKSLFTVQSPGGILGEFDSDETVDHFDTPWWNEFHDAVDDNEDHAREMINGKDVISIGLLGLDCAGGAHTCHVELHPIYIFAVRVSSDASSERWAFFARNRGDEGYCSSNEQYLPPGAGGKFEYSITIPNTRASTFFLHNRDVNFFKNRSSSPAGEAFKTQFIRKKGLKLTFVLTDPEKLDDGDDWVIEGEINIGWIF